MILAHSFLTTDPDSIANHIDVSFDGVYRSIYENRDLLKDKFNVMLFVIGNHVGGTNAFDNPKVLEKFCNWNEIMEMVYKGAKLGWHTWSHRDLTKCSYAELIKEITPPFPMDYFAYPYGKFNNKVIEVVRMVGFKDAWSVIQGNGEIYQRNREEL